MSANPLKSISDNRRELFGIAIIWIVFFHTDYFLPPQTAFTGFLGNSYAGFKSIGYFGVDVFIFLSGLGLITSWIRNPDIFRFYKRRILRLMPSFYAILIAEMVLITLFGLNNYYWRFISIKQGLLLFSGMDFFLTGRLVIWFISSLVFLYAIFPFAAKSFLASGRKALWASCAVLLFTALSICIPFLLHSYSYLLILTIRVPAFVFGMYAGWAISNKTPVPKYLTNSYLLGLILLLSTASLILIILNSSSYTRWEYGLWWYPCIVMVFPFVLLLSRLFDKLRKYPISRYIPLAAALIGTCSLELFLVHPVVFKNSVLFNQLNASPFYLILYAVLLGFLFKGLLELGGRLMRKTRLIFK